MSLQDPAGDTWARKAMASCYIHSPMAAIARRFRDKYHIASSSNGRWPGFSLQRRNEPSARILYYHRVNDDNDPFFPSMPTRVFERQIEFLARHYKIVSLAALRQHLANGSPGIVVSITFDDGYRDNYENAFPILQRYGVPATIFLTTGSIDADEPLWFEQMADAFQKTDRHSVDLEIGSTQRFMLGSTTEKLDAISRVFSFLRGLPNAERKLRMPEILRPLGIANAAQRSRMLAWDHIRLMQARGIDFGGHTVTHPFLSKLTREELFWEISQCKRRIEDELQSTVRHFAYPNGREEDFSDWNKEIIRQAGYQAAVSTIWGLNYPSTDCMELRRGQPWERHPALFAFKFDWYHLVNN